MSFMRMRLRLLKIVDSWWLMLLVVCCWSDAYGVFAAG